MLRIPTYEMLVDTVRKSIQRNHQQQNRNNLLLEKYPPPFLTF